MINVTTRAVREDAWTEEDDLILAEVTLDNIRTGSTQLVAFDVVGARIGRTSSACGFRWNSFVRKKYVAAIQIAKAQRSKLRGKRTGVVSDTTVKALANLGVATVTDRMVTKSVTLKFQPGEKFTFEVMPDHTLNISFIMDNSPF